MGTWSISTADGLVAEPGALMSVLESHHARVLEGWRGFTTDEWSRSTRNAMWSVHDTARHVADAIEQGAALAEGDNDLGSLHGFSPSSTPTEWLEASARESSADTSARYAAAASRFRDAVGSRLASGDDARATTVYPGDAHWTANIVHILWDSWIHERDVLLPLNKEQAATADEERIVGLYGVFMAGVPSKIFGQEMSAVIDLVGQEQVTLRLRSDGGYITCEEVLEGESQASGDHGTALDALSGRGLSVEDALPGAPNDLSQIAALIKG